MKEVIDWDENYVLSLPTGEHDWVEFKSSKALDFSLPGIKESVVLDNLSTQVSAFANSGGGTIVYGIDDAPAGSVRRVSAEGGISLNLKGGTKEWLEDQIPNLVNFPLAVFNIYVLISKQNNSQIGADKGLFLINIPSSETAPHQARDNKYYARIAGKSRPINHQFVVDIIGRAKYPKMKMNVRLLSDEEKYSSHSDNNPIVRFTCKNTGRVFANYVNGWVYIPTTLVHKRGYETTIDEKEYLSIYFENVRKEKIGEEKVTRRNFLGNQDSYYTSTEPLYITRYDPVLPGMQFGAATEELSQIEIDQLKDFSEEEIHWKIYADNAPVKKGFIKIKDLINA
jgi:Putative DNA-binding domain